MNTNNNTWNFVQTYLDRKDGPSRFYKLAKFKSLIFTIFFLFFHDIILFDVTKRESDFFLKTEMKISEINGTNLSGDLLLQVLLKTL